MAERKGGEVMAITRRVNLEYIIELQERAERAESELAKMKEENRWRKYPDEKPEVAGMECLVEADIMGDLDVYYDVWRMSDGMGTFDEFPDHQVRQWRPYPKPLPSAPEVTEERWADE